MRYTNKYFRTALVALMVMVTFSISAQSFEGVIKMSTTNAANGEKAQMEWLTSNGNHKMLINGTAEDGLSVRYALLFLSSSSNASMLTEVGGEKVMFNIPASSFQGQGLNISSPAVSKGGKADVNGFTATKYELEGAEGRISVWVSTQIPFTTDQLPAVMNKGGLLSILKANNISGIPVKVIATDANGKQLYSQTITSVSAKPIDASEFSLSGYGDGPEKMKDAVQKQ